MGRIISDCPFNSVFVCSPASIMHRRLKLTWTCRCSVWTGARTATSSAGNCEREGYPVQIDCIINEENSIYLFSSHFGRRNEVQISALDQPLNWTGGHISFHQEVPALRNASESSGLDGASNRLAVQAPLERDQQTADI